MEPLCRVYWPRRGVGKDQMRPHSMAAMTRLFISLTALLDLLLLDKEDFFFLPRSPTLHSSASSHIFFSLSLSSRVCVCAVVCVYECM